jgi:hypothetical protein
LSHTMSLSQNLTVPPEDVSAGEMNEAEVIAGSFHPPHEQAAVAIEPRSCALDDPTAGAFALRALRSDFFAARFDMWLVTTPTQTLAVRFAVVAEIAAQILATTAPRRGPAHGNAIERFEEQLHVMRVRAAYGHADGHAAAVGEDRALDAQLTAIGGISAGFFSPPNGALVIEPSTHCQFQPMPRRKS